MSVTTLPLTERPAWKALTAHFAAIQGKHLRELFASDPARGERLMANAIGIFHAFLDDPDVRLIGYEAGGDGVETGRHAATFF